MKKYFFIRTNGRYVRINFQDIIYLEGRRNYIRIVTESGFYMTLITMKQIEQLLPAALFRRIHKSYIVSMDRVVEFDSDTVYLKNKQLPIGENYRQAFENSLLIAKSEYKTSLMSMRVEYRSRKLVAG